MKSRALRNREGYEQFEVSVLDPTGTPPTMLDAAEFYLSGHPVIQRAEFAEYVPAAPASVGILIDTSDRAEDKIDQERDFAGALVRSLAPRDDVALMVYSRRAYLLQPMTSDRGGPLRMLPLVNARGTAALFDAAVQGINSAFNSACYARRSLVIIGSGFDNASHITAPDLIENAREQGVAIYFVGVGLSDSPRSQQEKAALQIVTRIVSESGGQIYPVGDANDRDAVESIAREISANMRGQYVVGFLSPGPSAEDAGVVVNYHPEYLVVSKRVIDGANSAGSSAPVARVYHSPQSPGIIVPEK